MEALVVIAILVLGYLVLRKKPTVTPPPPPPPGEAVIEIVSVVATPFVVSKGGNVNVQLNLKNTGGTAKSFNCRLECGLKDYPVAGSFISWANATKTVYMTLLPSDAVGMAVDAMGVDAIPGVVWAAHVRLYTDNVLAPFNEKWVAPIFEVI